MIRAVGVTPDGFVELGLGAGATGRRRMKVEGPKELPGRLTPKGDDGDAMMKRVQPAPEVAVAELESRRRDRQRLHGHVMIYGHKNITFPKLMTRHCVASSIEAFLILSHLWYLRSQVAEGTYYQWLYARSSMKNTINVSPGGHNPGNLTP